MLLLSAVHGIDLVRVGLCDEMAVVRKFLPAGLSTLALNERSRGVYHARQNRVLIDRCDLEPVFHALERGQGKRRNLFLDGWHLHRGFSSCHGPVERPWERRIEQLSVRGRRADWELLSIPTENEFRVRYNRRGRTASKGRRRYHPKVSLPIKVEAFDACCVERVGCVSIEGEPDDRAGVVVR